MDVSPCSTAPHFTWWLTPQIWHSVCNSRFSHSRNGTTSTIRDLYRCYKKFLSPYICCIWGRVWTTSGAMNASPYSVSSHFPCWEGTPNSTFYCNLRVKPIRCRTVWQSRDLYKLSELPLIFLIHQSKVMQHFSSNECLSSWCIIPLFTQREYLKFDISCAIWESTSAEMKWCGQ